MLERPARRILTTLLIVFVIIPLAGIIAENWDAIISSIAKVAIWTVLLGASVFCGVPLAFLVVAYVNMSWTDRGPQKQAIVNFEKTYRTSPEATVELYRKLQSALEDFEQQPKAWLNDQNMYHEQIRFFRARANELAKQLYDVDIDMTTNLKLLGKTDSKLSELQSLSTSTTPKSTNE